MHGLPLNDEHIASKYITPLSARNEEAEIKEDVHATTNLVSCLKGNRLDTGRLSQAKNYLSFDKRDTAINAKKF